jgi:hypothetical protein
VKLYVLLNDAFRLLLLDVERVVSNLYPVNHYWPGPFFNLRTRSDSFNLFFLLFYFFLACCAVHVYGYIAAFKLSYGENRMSRLYSACGFLNPLDNVLS